MRSEIPIDVVTKDVIAHCYPYKHSVHIVAAELSMSDSHDTCGWVYLAFEYDSEEQQKLIKKLADRLREVTKCIYGKPASVKAYIGLKDV